MSRSGFNVNDVFNELRKAYTVFDARMILDATCGHAGVTESWDDELSLDKGTELCMGLIDRGGPAFKVGTEIYKQYIQ